MYLNGVAEIGLNADLVPTGDKALSEPMISLATYICSTRGVKWYWPNDAIRCHRTGLNFVQIIAYCLPYNLSQNWYMETFSALLALCVGNSPVTGEFPSKRSVTRSFEVFFDLRLSKWLSIQPGRRWFKTPWSTFWRHCNISEIHSG